MRRILLTVAAMTALATGFLPPGPTAATPGQTSAIGKQLVLGGLPFPAAFTFFADGRILYGERFTGDIRIYDPSNGSNTRFFHVTKLATDGEQGLLGLAVHPRYPAKPYVYAYATRTINGTLRNQVLRITDSGGTGTAKKVIFSSDTVAGTYHDGGRILFGPDGMLYAVVGEAHSPANAQDLSNNAGKVLRMTPAGKAPPDDPFPGTPIFTYGLRNSFGFTFDPQTRKLWETENGPECNDEINLELSGQNHAWGPSETCSTPPSPPTNTNQDGPQPRIMPLAFFSPPIAPTGAAFCSGCGLTGDQGDLFFGAYNTGDIRDVKLTADRTGISSMSVVYTNASGILSMERGPDGALYFSDAGAIDKLVQM
ncbi:MAG TPA: PQQ-dependent sugar dehydrogenase [Actinomycetota bacterium]|nr:PQQ-dependent sugar dehydrogenase [Actinomycetota bacterium]